MVESHGGLQLGCGTLHFGPVNIQPCRAIAAVQQFHHRVAGPTSARVLCIIFFFFFSILVSPATNLHLPLRQKSSGSVGITSFIFHPVGRLRGNTCPNTDLRFAPGDPGRAGPERFLFFLFFFFLLQKVSASPTLPLRQPRSSKLRGSGAELAPNLRIQMSDDLKPCAALFEMAGI